MAAGDYLPAKNVRIVINSISYAIQSGDYSESIGDWDATNLNGQSNAQGLLAAEHGVDVVETMLNVTFLISASAIVDLKNGVVYTASYTGSDNVVNSGSWRCLKKGKPVSTRGGFLVNCSGKFTGVVTGQ